MRSLNRKNDEIRLASIEPNINPYADGSCFIKIGGTHVICTASIEETVPLFLKGKGRGWITAEYGMLPRATHSRTRRESVLGKVSGRSQEIQRLIGRALRIAVDLKKLGSRQIIIDCDVIQADGGTRTAAITGGYVALVSAIYKLLRNNIITTNPILEQIAAISCGILKDEVLVDLEYTEDSQADVDANFVMTQYGKLIEIQITAEKVPFAADKFNEMLVLAGTAIKALIKLQEDALSSLKVASF